MALSICFKGLPVLSSLVIAFTSLHDSPVMTPTITSLSSLLSPIRWAFLAVHMLL